MLAAHRTVIVAHETHRNFAANLAIGQSQRTVGDPARAHRLPYWASLWDVAENTYPRPRTVRIIGGELAP